MTPPNPNPAPEVEGVVEAKALAGILRRCHRGSWRGEQHVFVRGPIFEKVLDCLESLSPPERPGVGEGASGCLTVGYVEASALLGISVASLRRYKDAKIVPEPITIGGRVLWIRDELISWVKSGAPARLAASTNGEQEGGEHGD